MGGDFMRKVVLFLLCCVILGGCGGSEAQSTLNIDTKSSEDNVDSVKEYSFNDLKRVCNWVTDELVNSMEGLSDIELSGTSNDEAEQNKHRREVYDKYTEKIMEQCEIKQGQKVIVSGYLGGNLHEVQSGSWTEDVGKISFSLKHDDNEDDWENSIHCRTNDNDFINLKENTPVKIEAVFMKRGTATGGGECLYDCKIIESGEPEIVTETKEPIVTAAYK